MAAVRKRVDGEAAIEAILDTAAEVAGRRGFHGASSSMLPSSAQRSYRMVPTGA